MGASESRRRGDLEQENDTDTGAARNPSRRPRRACIGDSGGSAEVNPSENHNAVYRDTDPRVISDNPEFLPSLLLGGRRRQENHSSRQGGSRGAACRVYDALPQR